MQSFAAHPANFTPSPHSLPNHTQEELDHRLLVQLRDGRTLLGTLRSFDQFANLVLESAVERVTAGNEYADTPLGVHVVRGENVVLMGRVEDEGVPPGMARGDAKNVKAAAKAEKEAERAKKTMRARLTDYLGDDF